MFGWLRGSLISISPDEASFARRGFTAGEAIRQRHLEHCARSFIVGYNASVRTADVNKLPEMLASVDRSSRGFAYEGAGMGFALLDGLNPVRCMRGSPRFNRYLQGAGHDHVYMAHVGVGWAVARLPWLRGKLDTYVQQFDGLLRWLIYDGYGFHQGFFDPTRFVQGQERPRGVCEYGLRAFDQGLGRCLWFVHGGDVLAVANCIARFDAPRHVDLYSGVGLAITYAGGAASEDAEALLCLADSYRWNLAQGAAFAAKARLRARNMTEHTGTMCHILCGCCANDAAEVTDKCLNDLETSSEVPAYEVWRAGIAAAIEKRERCVESKT